MCIVLCIASCRLNLFLSIRFFSLFNLFRSFALVHPVFSIRANNVMFFSSVRWCAMCACAMCILFILCWQSKHLDTYVSNIFFFKLFMIITFSVSIFSVQNASSFHWNICTPTFGCFIVVFLWKKCVVLLRIGEIKHQNHPIEIQGSIRIINAFSYINVFASNSCVFWPIFHFIKSSEYVPNRIDYAQIDACEMIRMLNFQNNTISHIYIPISIARL